MKKYTKEASIFFNKFLIILAFSLILPTGVLAVMTSTSYTIYADSVGYGGGGLATSTSYSLENTNAEVAVGAVTSTTYEVRGGYQAMDRNDLSISVSKSALSLGTLETSLIRQDSVVITVAALSTTGYTLTISSASGSMPAAVTDGEVTSGSEEYGLSASGAHSSVSGDVAVIAGRELSSSDSPTAGTAITLTFKASRTGNTTPGDYSQTITLQASANF